MNDWNINPTNPPRTYRFVVGEIAIFNVVVECYFGTPCEIMAVGPMYCNHCKNVHDYEVQMCDGRVVMVNDGDLKKFQPPADEHDESEVEELEHENA